VVGLVVRNVTGIRGGRQRQLLSEAADRKANQSRTRLPRKDLLQKDGGSTSKHCLGSPIYSNNQSYKKEFYKKEF
jgi:hypothetical protein